MQNKVSTFIISDNKQTENVLKSYLSDFEAFETIVCDEDSLLSSIEVLEKSFVIVDLSNDFDLKLELISRISSAYSNCRILALCDNLSLDVIVKAMRAGAAEFLPLPIIKSELADVLDRVSSSLTTVVKKKANIISVFSNKGGIGKTTIASNLALELAKITKEKVLLLDLNFQLGDVTTFLDLKPSFNISYFFQNIDKINEEFLLSTLERYKNTDLYVLADSPYFKRVEGVTPVRLAKLFNALRETFSYIVIDAESCFDEKNITALTESDLIFLVTIANLPALRNSQRCLELFDKLGFDENKTQILLNRYMENDEVSVKDIENVLNKKLYWKIPNNYFTMMSSINKGIPVSDYKPESNVAKSYRDLALYITDGIYKSNVEKRFEKVLGGNFGT